MNAMDKSIRRRQEQRQLDFEKLEQRSMLAVTSTFLDLIGRLTIQGDSSNETILVSRTAPGQILVNGNPVANATVNNTDTVIVKAGNGNDAITIDQTIGAFSPGRSTESAGRSEIEFVVDGQGGGDSLTIIGRPVSDTINVGVNGVNLNNDNDADVTFSNIASIRIRGGPGSDILRSTQGSDVGAPVAIDVILDGGDGDDILSAFSGIPTGPGGNITAIGGRGNDRYQLFGSESSDQISASFDAGTGQLIARVLPSFLTINQTHKISGFESVFLDSNDGDDLIDFSAISENDRNLAGITELELEGGAGANTIRGSLGPDQIKSFGTDEVFGLGGNDRIFSIGGQANIRGGSGDDRISLSGLQNFDIVVGGSGNDLLEFTASIPGIDPSASLSVRRDAATNELILRRSAIAGTNDSSEARASVIESLKIVGGGEDDELDASLLFANDLLSLGITALSIFGNDGNDLLIGSGANDIIFGGSGNDRILGLQGNDTLQGNEGNDEIFGGAGNDTINGGLGDDRLFGEDGNDTLIGGGGNDLLDEGPGQGGVLIHGTPGNDVILVGRAVFNGIPHVITTINGVTTFEPYLNGETIIVLAGAGNDVVILQASAWNNWQAIFHGGAGNDSLHGGFQDDQLFGEAGNDWLFGLAGNDILVGGDGNDWLFGHAGRDLLIGGNGTDRLFGGLNDDIVIGGRTAWDADKKSLVAISREWNGPGSYENRTSALLHGSGSNLSGTGIRLKQNSTVIDDQDLDRLFGESGRDLFFKSITDGVFDWLGNEVVIL